VGALSMDAQMCDSHVCVNSSPVQAHKRHARDRPLASRGGVSAQLCLSQQGTWNLARNQNPRNASSQSKFLTNQMASRAAFPLAHTAVLV
jgi:hypothetical protein